MYGMKAAKVTKIQVEGLSAAVGGGYIIDS